MIVPKCSKALSTTDFLYLLNGFHRRYSRRRMGGGRFRWLLRLGLWLWGRWTWYLLPASLDGLYKTRIMDKGA